MRLTTSFWLSLSERFVACVALIVFLPALLLIAVDGDADLIQKEIVVVADEVELTMDRGNPIGPDARFDRLVDGELSEEERRAMKY